MLFKNTLAQSSGAFVAYVASLVLAPVMLARLGLEAFGVWAVTGALVTYARALDFGIGRSLARFVALYEAAGDRRGMQECVGLGLIAVTGLSVVGIVAAWLSAPLVADVLDALSAEDMRVVMVSSVVLGMTYAYAQALNALPIGMRRMVPPNVANTVATLINLAFSLTALALSTSLTDYALANAAAGVVGMVPYLVVLAYVGERPYAALPSKSRIAEVLGYGIKGQVNWIADLVNLETDKLIIAVMLDVRIAGAYEVGSRVAVAVRSFGILTFSAMIPTATAEIVKGGRLVIPRFYRRYLKLSVGTSFGLFAVSCVTAPFALVAWLGEIPDRSDGVLVLLVVGYAMNITTGVGTSLAMAEGRPGLVAVYSAIPAGLNIALTLILAPLFGLWGVLTATVLAWSVGSLLFVRAYQRLHGMAWRDYLQAVLPPTALCAALAVPFVLWYALGGTVPDTRLPALIGATAIAASFGLPYWLIAGRLGLLPERLTASHMRGMRRAARASSQ
jgi:O-antigen/teichoic acid export membrane protein